MFGKQWEKMTKEQEAFDRRQSRRNGLVALALAAALALIAYLSRL